MLIELALRNLARTKVRSVLAVVGIIIGVMAISSIGIFGESLKAVVLKNFKDVADEILITPSYTYGYTSIDERTVEKIEKMPYAEKVIAVKSDSDLVVYKDKKRMRPSTVWTSETLKICSNSKRVLTRVVSWVAT